MITIKFINEKSRKNRRTASTFSQIMRHSMGGRQASQPARGQRGKTRDSTVGEVDNGNKIKQPEWGTEPSEPALIKADYPAVSAEPDAMGIRDHKSLLTGYTGEIMYNGSVGTGCRKIP